jgi:hypothetical protein
MKKILSFATVIIAASALTASAQWYVNTFDEMANYAPNGGYVPNVNLPVFSGLGMSYSISSGVPATGSVYAFQYPQFPIVPPGTDWAISPENPFDSLTVKRFTGGVIGIKGSFWLTDIQGNPAPQGAGTLGANIKLSNGTDVPFPLGVGQYFAPAGLTVSEFSLFQIGGQPDVWPTMDNFGVTNVPEPAVIVTNALVLAGALGGAWVYRSRKA